MSSSSSEDIRNLALKYGAMEIIKATKAKPTTKSMYNFLIVLDFEATCWEVKPSRRTENEIIEFSAVLLDVHQAKILSDFQHFVHPTEHPTLTPFCTSLTGITQATVDEAPTLSRALAAFNTWVQDQRDKYAFTLTRNAYAPCTCTFATWSDWDLGTCLKKECKRKRLAKEDYFNQWIDVRKTYVEFYKEKPLGLLGALHATGLQFVGQEHCGLDDARNTAHLLNRMVLDGATLEITKFL